MDQRRLLSALVSLLLAAPAAAQPVADFYRSKVVTIIVGSSEGGTFDTFGRVAAPVLKRLLPGAPTIVVQNMPGASFVRATEYVYNVAPRDGTVLLVAQPYIVLNKLLNPSAKYAPEEFVWLGRMAPLQQVGFVTADSGVTAVDQVKQRELTIGAAGATGPGALVPWMLNRLIGTRFKLVRGYESDSGLYIAVQRREILGMGSTSYSELKNRGWVASGEVRPLYAISLSRLHDLPDLATIGELAEPGRARDILNLFTSIPVLGYTMFGPPGLPADRADALRTAFAEMLKDRDFIEGERRAHVEIEAWSGSEVQALVKRIAATPRDLVEALKVASEPMN